MVSLSLLITVLSVGIATVCPTTYPQDVKVVFGYEGSSDRPNLQRALQQLVEGLTEFGDHMTKCKNEFLVMNIRGSDKSGDSCVYAVTSNEGWPHPGGWNGSGSEFKPIEIAGRWIQGLTLKERYVADTPAVEMLIYIARTRWARQAPGSSGERRIFIWVARKLIQFHEKEFILPTTNLKELYTYCPEMSKTTTQEQMAYTLKSRGIAFFVVMEAYSGTFDARPTWTKLFKTLDVSDYHLEFPRDYSLWFDGAQFILRGLLKLASTSWVATTTTYKPFAKSYDVEVCLYEMREGINDVIAQQADYRAKVLKCVLAQ